MRVAVPRPAVRVVPLRKRRRRRRRDGGLGGAPHAAAVVTHRLRAHAQEAPLQRRVLRLRRGSGNVPII